MSEELKCPFCGKDITEHPDIIAFLARSARIRMKLEIQPQGASKGGSARTEAQKKAHQAHMAIVNANYSPEKRQIAQEKRKATMLAKKQAKKSK